MNNGITDVCTTPDTELKILDCDKVETLILSCSLSLVSLVHRISLKFISLYQIYHSMFLSAEWLSFARRSLTRLDPASARGVPNSLLPT